VNDAKRGSPWGVVRRVVGGGVSRGLVQIHRHDDQESERQHECRAESQFEDERRAQQGKSHEEERSVAHTP
jgi:hypothetical protein